MLKEESPGIKLFQKLDGLGLYQLNCDSEESGVANRFEDLEPSVGEIDAATAQYLLDVPNGPFGEWDCSYAGGQRAFDMRPMLRTGGDHQTAT